MKIIATKSTTRHGAIDREIHTETGVMWITTYDEVAHRWFVTYELNDRNTLRIVDRMDRHTWNKVWSEFRRLQH